MSFFEASFIGDSERSPGEYHGIKLFLAIRKNEFRKHYTAYSFSHLYKRGGGRGAGNAVI